VGAQPCARGSALSSLALIAVCFLTCEQALAGQASDDWWNAAWSHRKRVRVSLPAMEPMGWGWRPPAGQGDEIVPAQAMLRTEIPLEAGAQREIRVVDAGGNVLPAVVSGPDSRGLVHVIFPARRTIAGELAAPIVEGSDTAQLSVGRDKAVMPGLRVHVMAGHDPVATLEVTAVAEKTATAKVVETTVPQIAKGTPVRSATLTGADYHIYYGNPKAAEAGPAWTPPPSAVRRYTWRITGGGPPTTVEALRERMRNNVELAGADSLAQMSSRANPQATGEDTFYIAAYESHCHVGLGGLYRFSLDTYGPSFVFIDGRLAAQRQGFFMQTGQWEHRGKIELEAGYHHLVMFAVESGQRQVSRLGWQPITAKVYGPTPASFYVTHVGGDAVGYDTREARGLPFFTCSLAPRSVVVEGKRAYQFVQLHNHTPFGRDDALAQTAWEWELPDGEKSRQRSPGHLFGLPEKGEPAAFPVVLRAFRAGELVGQYERIVHCDPRPRQPLRLSLDIVSFSNIVYADERTSIAVRLRNATLSPLVLRAVGRLESGGKSEIILRRHVHIGAENEDFCILPIDMKQLDPKRATVELGFDLAGQEVRRVAMRIIPSPEGLAGLRRGLGALFDDEGRRVMICSEIEDRDRHLRWVFYNYLRDEVIPRSRKTRTRVLLFGDRMANPVRPDQSFTDYVALLDARLKAEGRQLTFAERSVGLLPTLADLILFAKTVGQLETFPDIIILSPGLADVVQASGERDVVRSVDVLIDVVRKRAPRTKIVIVSPPPYPGNPRLSKHYTEALAKLAREHHYPFLDLHRLLIARDDQDWVKDWYAAPDADGIFLANPNEQAHKRIAEALAKLIY